jgi:hypothetical protein
MLLFIVHCVDAPRVAQYKVELPLNLVCKGAQPMKNATHKVCKTWITRVINLRCHLHCHNHR